MSYDFPKTKIMCFSILVTTAAPQFVLHSFFSQFISEANNQACVFGTIDKRYEGRYDVRMYVCMSVCA